MLQHKNLLSFPKPYNLDKIYRNSIIGLKKISLVARYTYIARHSNNKVPDQILPYFKGNFPDIAKEESHDKVLRIPTVWLVCYSDNKDNFGVIENFLSEKNYKYFPVKGIEYKSLSNIPFGHYTTSANEAATFPKYLEQITQIGLNLLENSDHGKFLSDFIKLEFRKFTNNTEPNQLESDLRQKLIKDSLYYYENIEKIANERQEFWINFRKVYDRYSWPHFLFNICGINA